MLARGCLLRQDRVASEPRISTNTFTHHNTFVTDRVLMFLVSLMRSSYCFNSVFRKVGVNVKAQKLRR
eukprot:3986272-Amphidinium_carterae.2